MNYKLKLPIALGVLTLTHNAVAGGLSLPQVGTAESTGTAGVSNVTNNRDASAVITNPAALSGIEGSSLMLGLQYLDVNNNFEREGEQEGTNGSSGQFMPHISYAKRLNEQWVVGIASHGPGGLGINYDNGLIGGDSPDIVESNMIAIMNITTSASYQVNEQLSLGGSVIAQYAGLKTELSPNNTEITGSDWTASFALSGLYQFNSQTQVGMTYNYGAQHDVDVESNHFGNTVPAEINWPQSVEVGLQHQLSDKLAFMVSANWQQWSRFGDGLGQNYDDTYGAGIAMSYQLDSWKLHSGFSVDSSPLTAENRGHALPLDEQWRLGFGAEKKLKNGMLLGLAYQYQSLGDAEITGSGMANGEYEDNRVHFITGSLSF